MCRQVVSAGSAGLSCVRVVGRSSSRAVRSTSVMSELVTHSSLSLIFAVLVEKKATQETASIMALSATIGPKNCCRRSASGLPPPVPVDAVQTTGVRQMPDRSD